MHEWGITQDLIDEVKRQALAKKMTKVTKIGVSVGKLSDITGLAIKTCFQALSKEDPLFKSTKIQIKKTLDHKVFIDTIQGKA